MRQVREHPARATPAGPLGRRFERTQKVTVPGIAFVVALGAAVAGAILTGTTVGQVNTGVELLSSSAGSALGRASTMVPLGFAFGAGMVSAVNPCGFSLLPAYLGLYMRSGTAARRDASAGRHLGRALVVGGTVSAGVVVLFAATGIAIGFGAQMLVEVFPWVGLGVGVAMIATGAWLLGGRSLYSAPAERLGTRIGDPTRRNIRGYFLFGLGYGMASLSCTLPIFLSVVGGSVTATGPLVALGEFILYGVGMSAVILALTLSIAIFQVGLVGPLRQAQRFVGPVGAVLALAAGSYITYYWLTLGGLLDALR